MRQIFRDLDRAERALAATPSAARCILSILGALRTQFEEEAADPDARSESRGTKGGTGDKGKEKENANPCPGCHGRMGCADKSHGSQGARQG